jgi:hypothetical protein
MCGPPPSDPALAARLAADQAVARAKATSVVQAKPTTLDKFSKVDLSELSSDDDEPPVEARSLGSIPNSSVMGPNMMSGVPGMGPPGELAGMFGNALQMKKWKQKAEEKRKVKLARRRHRLLADGVDVSVVDTVAEEMLAAEEKVAKDAGRTLEDEEEETAAAQGLANQEQWRQCCAMDEEDEGRELDATQGKRAVLKRLVAAGDGLDAPRGGYDVVLSVTARYRTAPTEVEAAAAAAAALPEGAERAAAVAAADELEQKTIKAAREGMGPPYDVAADPALSAPFFSCTERSFRLGTEQLPLGVEQGLLTMRDGERVLLTVVAERGFGKVGCETHGVPPDVTLVYDVTLHSFSERVELKAADGSLIKTRLKAGDSWERPEKSSECNVVWSGLVEDTGTRFVAEGTKLDVYLEDVSLPKWWCVLGTDSTHRRRALCGSARSTHRGWTRAAGTPLSPR